MSGVPAAVKTLGRHAFRGYGMLTAGHRPAPDFLLIGTKRGGTTTTYYSLLEHPNVMPQWPSARLVPKTNDTKGVHYFDSNGTRSARWYRSHFETARARAAHAASVGGTVVTGDGSPYYLYHPLAAGRAAAMVPDAKLIVLLRHPIERAYSHFREQTRNGVETLSWETALDAEAARTAGEVGRILADPSYRSFPHEQQSYVGQSEYAASLRRWFENFDRSQFLIRRSEDLYADPVTTLDEIWTFLGVGPYAGGSTMRWNAAPQAEMDPAIRRRLEAHFEPHVRDLEALLGRAMGWDPW